MRAGPCLEVADGAEVLTGPDPPDRAETLLHVCAHTRVTRLSSPGRSVVRKEPLGPDAQRRLAHEVAMLERLRGVGGGAPPLPTPPPPGAILLGGPGGTT